MRKAIVFTLVMSLLLFSSCSAQDEKSGDELKDVTLVLDWLPNTNHVGIYAAKELGIYEEFGINLEIKTPPEDGALALLGSGKADFGICVQEEIALALTAENPLPVIGVAALVPHNTSGLVSLKEKDISSPKDLEGMTYATWQSPIEQGMLRHIMEKDGGDYSQLNMIPTMVYDIFSALETQVDTVWIFYGWDGIALLNEGIEFNYISFADEESMFDYYTPFIASNEDYLKNNPETAKAFLEATKKGYEYVKGNPEEGTKLLLEAVPDIDETLAYKSVEWLSDRFFLDDGSWGFFEEERFNGFFAWLYEEELLSEPIEEGRGFTNEYLSK